MKLLTKIKKDEMVRGIASIETPHWFQEKAIRFGNGGARRPKNIKEWLICIWNADVFYGEVPFLKTLAVISILISLLV